jgi:dihydrofolate reductase
MPDQRKVVLFIAVSLDGFIAGPGDDLSFLDSVQQEGEDYGYSAFMRTVDTIIMGRRTYDWVMKQTKVYPHSDTETYIISHKQYKASGRLRFYNGNLKDLILQLKSREGKNIFIDGGAEIVNELLEDKLFDELIISVIPVLLGDGIKLFRDGKPIQRVSLQSTRGFESGLVQLHYKVISDNH